MRPSALGRYLLYDSKAHFVARGPLGDVVAAQQPERERRLQGQRRGVGQLPDRAHLGRQGTVGLGSRAASSCSPTQAAPAALFSLQPATGCATFPEVETSTVGTPAPGRTPYGEVKGYLDAHMHMMAFEFLGGSVHCGRPWSPYGVTVALVDCPDHYPNGGGAVLENVLFKAPARTHDPVGWPTFKDWPHTSRSRTRARTTSGSSGPGAAGCAAT